MAFQMSYSKEELSGAPPVPAGKYTLQFKGFRPKTAKNGDSVNLNGEFSVIGVPEFENRKVFANFNNKAGFILVDFTHACGLKMEEAQDEFAGTEKANHTLPGVFENMDTYPDDPTQWKYQGPLLNKTLEVELAETDKPNGGKKNEIRQFYCAVPGCTDKHSTNLIK